jgi:hypothetical protein
MVAPYFTKADIAKAIRAVKEAGLNISRVDVDRRTGVISVFTGDGTSAGASPEDEIAQMVAHIDRQAARRSRARTVKVASRLA